MKSNLSGILGLLHVLNDQFAGYSEGVEEGIELLVQYRQQKNLRTNKMLRYLKENFQKNEFLFSYRQNKGLFLKKITYY